LFRVSRLLVACAVCSCALAALAASSAYAAFPGANGKIAFTRSSGHGDIFTVNPDGTGETQLTNPSTGGDFQAQWSPTGKQILFSHQAGSGASTVAQIWVMNADGTSQHQLSNSASQDFSAAWSPDGTHIAFNHANFATGTSQIWVMNADGSGGHNISNNAFVDGAPQWSPDGKTIVFVRLTALQNGRGQIWAMNADGSGQHQLTTNDPSTLSVGSPSWSPDGTQIAYTYNVLDQGGNEQIWVMNANGTNQHAVASNGTHDDFGPSWSPDGSQIVFADNSTGLVLIDANGANRHNLTANSSDFRANWQPLNADLSLAKAASASTTTVGDIVTYTLTVRNNGLAPANGLALTDVLPSQVKLASVSTPTGSCSGSATVTCSLGTLASGAATTVMITVRATHAGSAVDRAAAFSFTPDPNPTDNFASATTTIQNPGLALSRLKGHGHGASLSIRCGGTPGTVCSGTARLIVRERRRGRHIVGLARTVNVVVGQVSYTVVAGRTRIVSIHLNRTGRRLLRRFRKLRVRGQVTANGVVTTQTARRVTIRLHR
jgi:uncharacterized repeat protein (TIGR01451 family)